MLAIAEQAVTFARLNGWDTGGFESDLQVFTRDPDLIAVLLQTPISTTRWNTFDPWSAIICFLSLLIGCGAGLLSHKGVELFAAHRAMLRDPFRCGCGYDLRGVPDSLPCPECSQSRGA